MDPLTLGTIGAAALPLAVGGLMRRRQKNATQQPLSFEEQARQEDLAAQGVDTAATQQKSDRRDTALAMGAAALPFAALMARRQ